ncbi:MAG: hypothetical protein ACOY0T_13685 [Myxococcota bacterium]
MKSALPAYSTLSSALAISAALLTTLACSSDANNPAGQGGKTAAGGSSSQGGSTSNGGATGNGGSTNANGGSSNSGGASNGGSSNGGSSNSGGASNGGSSQGGSNSSGGSSNSGGATNQGGSTASGGAAPQGGSSAQGGSSQGGSAPQGGSGGTSGSGCPAKASFCSGFEETTMPAGAVFKLNGDPATPWTASFEVDTTIKNSGKSSLRVKAASEGGSGGAYKMLAVPSGGSKFWVRMYIRSDKDLGDIKHNVLAQAAATDSPNDTPHMEFGEDVGISWHFDDSAIRWPMDYGRLSNGTTKPYTLAKDTWHCVELYFDGEAKVHRAFVNGTEIINATNFPAMTLSYTFFKFGYNSLNGTDRKTWYDDLVVAPERVPCL